jgi:two-component system sensor histidine kinase HydH
LGLPRKAALLVLLAVSTGLPVVLVLHSIWAMRELREMRAIFLRDRAAAIAARIEAMAGEDGLGRLSEDDPALVDVRIFRASDPADPDGPVGAIRAGRELFHTETSGNVFRAYVPAHVAGQAVVARIELSADAPDALLVHGRHNVAVAAASGGLLMALAGLALWSMNRAWRLERRQMETERLAELGSLSAVLAHEIRNPLGTIKGFAQLAGEGAGPRAAKPLEAIVREAQRLERLATSLLQYGRPQQPALREVSWPAIASDLEAHAREAIGGRPIEFTAGGDLTELRTDPDLLKQALLNLVRNAVEAIPEGDLGAVRINATREAAGFTIVVEDNGSGLPEPVRSRVFDPFVTTKASGAGLGLPISKKLVESLGGELRLCAANPRGTKAEMVFHGTTSHH